MAEEPAWTTEEILSRLRGRLIERAAMGAAYRDSWGNDYVVKSLREAWEATDAPRRLTVAELMELSDETLRSFGFGSWDGALTLVPLWAYPLLAHGEVLTSISGDTGTVGEEVEPGRPAIDLDVRFGCIAYGFTKPGAVPIPDEAEAA
jgi:hypothetical protein